MRTMGNIKAVRIAQYYLRKRKRLRNKTVVSAQFYMVFLWRKQKKTVTIDFA